MDIPALFMVFKDGLPFKDRIWGKPKVYQNLSSAKAVKTRIINYSVYNVQHEIHAEKEKLREEKRKQMEEELTIVRFIPECVVKIRK